jgi:hypothetical protein
MMTTSNPKTEYDKKRISSRPPCDILDPEQIPLLAAAVHRGAEILDRDLASPL